MDKKFIGDNKIVALHGFLGEPKDFLPLGLAIDAPTLSLWPLLSMNDWAEKFNQWVRASVLLGYSMGGRLALHCLLKNPPVKAAIIIAAHPGLQDEKQRKSRLITDQAWAYRFKNEPWSTLMASWNEQEIFQGSTEILRDEKNFSRAELSAYLENFSLGRQEDLLPQINNLPMPILWLVPVREQEKAAGLKLKNPLSQVKFIEGGHRFIFDQPRVVALLIEEFLRLLSGKHLIKCGQDEQS